MKVYFENGQVTHTTPPIKDSYYENRNLINEATTIVSDDVEYDLTDRASIYSIDAPEYKYETKNTVSNELGVTGYLEYVLRMHASLLWNDGKYDLAIPCLAKATQLMLYSTVGWPQKDFYRIVNWNIELGRFKKAKEWENWIINNTRSLEDLELENFEECKKSAKFLKTDLVEVDDVGVRCAVCQKYRNRIYSISGKNLLFPKFPNDFHFGCGLIPHPFIMGVNEPTFECSNIVLYSRRPFRDDRTKEEKENYLRRLEQKKREDANVQMANLNHIIYHWIKARCPEILPKSLSAFSRMRNANSETYKKIIKQAEDFGCIIPQSLEEAAELEGCDIYNGKKKNCTN